jgi:membrane protein required for colicin V production
LPSWTDIQTWLQSNINGLDAVFLCILVVYSIRGLVRGLSSELAGAIGFLLILVGGWKLYRPISDWLLANTRLSSMESADLLALIFSIVVLATVLGLIKFALRNLFEKAFAGTMERLGGFSAGLCKGFVICTIFVLGVKLSGHAYLTEHVITQSSFGTFVSQRLPGWYWALRDRVLPPKPEQGDDQEICDPEDPAKNQAKERKTRSDRKHLKSHVRE